MSIHNKIKEDSIFFVSDEDKKRLKLDRKQTMDDNIIRVFMVARIQNQKTELTLDEITIAYHNLVTKPDLERNPKTPIKTKKDIAQKLFMMRQDKKKVRALIELVPGKRGTYRLKKTTD